MLICECGSEALNETTHRDPARNTHKPVVIQEVDLTPWTADDEAALAAESLSPEDKELL